MPCYHQHLQQRYHNQKANIFIFVHFMHVAILFPLTKAIPIIFECVTTHYQTLQTWIRRAGTHYLNFKALPHALPHALPYIFCSLTWLSYNAMCHHNFNVFSHVLPYVFSTFTMVWDYLEHVTSH